VGYGGRGDGRRDMVRRLIPKIVLSVKNRVRSDKN